MPDLPILLFASEADWLHWLEEQHALSAGVWLKIAKKESGQASVSYQAALEVALCFGWIDGQKGKFDEQFWLQKFTPRRNKSVWSRINREKVETLIAQGKMREAGLRAVEAAKADGRWERAYASQRTMAIPADFQKALDEQPEARAFFEQLNSVNRYAFLYRITTAKNPETRQKRIETFIAMLNAKQKLHP
jgi:uncharacterized protein YdeI (YjbR/CyaY-like superfamily)